MPNVGFEVDVEQALAERFPRHRGIAIDVVADHVEVVAAPVDGDVAPPVVDDAFIADVVAVEGRDPVRTAAERRDKGVRARIALGVVVCRPHGEPGQRDEVGVGEHIAVVHDDFPCVDDRQRFDPRLEVDLAEDGLQQYVVGEPDVVRRHGYAVVPTRVLVQSQVE